jgi:hypothetical protein
MLSKIFSATQGGLGRQQPYHDNLDKISPVGYIRSMEWEVEFTDEFEEWWDKLSEEEQDSVAMKVGLLKTAGPALGRPHADKIQSSRHQNMQELIVQHAGRP